MLASCLVHSSTPDLAGISRALEPYLGTRRLSGQQLEQVHLYLGLLLRWNQRINLTAVREPSEIIGRHFGESFFLASLVGAQASSQDAIDVGSGAGFPGIPFKILAGELRMTLIESNYKKATFLKEVIRTLTLTDIDVFPGRAQELAAQAGLVTMRAVEKFERALAAAAALARPTGRLALLIGSSQTDKTRQLLPRFKWEAPVFVPQSRERVALIGVNS